MVTIPTPPSRAPRRRTVVAAAAAGAVAGFGVTGPAAAAAGTTSVGPPRRLGPAAEAWIAQVVRRMSLEEKVGQLLVTHVYGATADTPDARNTSTYGVATPAEIVAKYHLGGICYFTWSGNISEPRQVAGLSNGLQRAAVESGAGVPLLISTDQEQGTIVRVGPPATQFPGNMALGASRDAAAAREAAAITGKELAALGINQDYAPVADVNVDPANPVIGVRSFGADPTLARTLTAAQVKGYERDAGIIATAKHFPGHGDTELDSHTEIPVIRHTKEQWEQIDAPPFEAAIEAGIGSIMTGHLVFPELDPSEDPATLSYPIMTGILREQLGYDGVVCTDSLGMQGVRDKYGDDRVVVLAVNAGVDMLLRPPAFDLAHQALLEAVRAQEISRRRLDEAVTRILRLKLAEGIVHEPYVDVDEVDEIVGTPDHLARADRITERTTTLVKNGADLLPLAPGARTVLVTGSGVAATATLAEAMTDRGATAESYATGTRPTDTAIATAVERAAACDLTIVLTQKAWDTKETDPQARQQRLVHALVATGRAVVVVAVNDPYDIAHFTEAQTYLVTYAGNAVAMRACARVLFGEVSPRGKLPVSIPSVADPATPLYPYGHGLTW
ncbi:glycoside hydrolase family 3 protein [Actinopolymorpha sp. B17G11]|uniref:glycoside hydrolase family 3 protein n=1 Tax=unclassified Actinopolymorpha TaxID=2627063 RepID=UPI0032D9978F